METENIIKNEENPQNIELALHQNYSIRLLTQKYREAALNILSQEFCDQQALVNAYWRQFPEQKQNGKKFLHELWSMFIENCIENKMSVVAVDTEKDEVVGVFIARDFRYIPEQFIQKFMMNLNAISSVLSFQMKTLTQTQEYKEILSQQSQKVVEMFAVAIRKQYNRKQLFVRMLTENEKLAKKQGFQYAFGSATGFAVGVGFSKLHYTKISQTECRQYEHFGVKPFYLVDELNSKPTIWLKKLD